MPHDEPPRRGPDPGRLLEELALPVAAFEPVTGDDGRIVDFRWVYANQAALDLMKLRWEEVRHTALSEMLPSDSDIAMADHIAAFHGGRPISEDVTFRGDQFDGWLAIRSHRIGDVMVARFEDITEVRRLQAEKDAALATVQQVHGRINDAMYAVDRDWRFTMVNASAERLLGRSADELIGRVLGHVFPEGDGSGIGEPFRHALATGEAASFDVYYPPPLDSWFRVRLYPDHDGLTVHFGDIGAERRVQDQLARYDRLESVATLAGGVAHDFNNLLMVVSGHASFLAEDLPPDHPGHEDLRAIEEATRRATELTRRLLSYSSQQVVNPQQLDLSSAVSDVLSRMDGRVPPGVELAVYAAPEPTPVEMDPTELERVVTHLVDNAVTAMADGGRLVVEVSSAEIDHETQRRHPDRPAGRYAVLAVSDDGTGMGRDVLDRAIEPFFTTRRAHGGTGLGLSAVHGIVRQAGGHVVLYSEPGIGTTVRVFLPSSDVSAAPPARATEDLSGTEAVLLVDDNAEVAGLVRRSLSEAGYRVVMVSGAAEALERIRSGDHDDIALLVTDVVMPDMNGIELSDAVRSELGPVPVLFVSGFTERAVAADGATRPAVEFLAKPFTRHELLTSTRRLLDGSPPGERVGRT